MASKEMRYFAQSLAYAQPTNNEAEFQQDDVGSLVIHSIFGVFVDKGKFLCTKGYCLFWIPITGYRQWIVSLKKRYRQSQLKAAVKVNEELISFYWSLGRDIAMMKPEEKWGQGFYDTLSRDLRQSLPDAKGFSYRNLHYMRQFHGLFPFLENMQQAVAQIGSGEVLGENEIAQQAVAQMESGIAPQLVAQIVSIPWGRIRLIMNRCGKDQRKALFYVNQTVLNNWSRATPPNFAQSDLYAREGKAITNFDRSLPEEGSDLAQQITKDPYDSNLDIFIHRTITARISNFFL